MARVSLARPRNRHLKVILIVIVAFGPLLSLISPAMAEGSWVDGTVTDADTGLPIEGANVTIDGYSDYTNASGFYSIEVSPGTYNVTAEMAGYVNWTVVDVLVSPNETVVQDFALTPIVGWIEGNVTDANTSFPIEGASVTVNGYSDYTNASGRYRFEVLLGTYNVIAEMIGYKTQTVTNVSVSAYETVIQDFSLSPVGWIEGNVTDTYTHRPVEGASVTVDGYSDYTNASGFYRFELFPGTYNVTVEMKGYVSNTAIGTTIAANMTTTVDFGLLPSIESSDVTGNPKDTFFPMDEMYVTGFDYSPFTTYDFYVVEDVATWIDGMDIPPRVNGTATTVSSDASGYIQPTLVWSYPLVIGNYDIVVDVNNNSVYDDGVDDLDDNDTEVTAGFTVIPELASFLILPLFMTVTLLAVIIYRRKHCMTQTKRLD